MIVEGNCDGCEETRSFDLAGIIDAGHGSDDELAGRLADLSAAIERGDRRAAREALDLLVSDDPAAREAVEVVRFREAAKVTAAHAKFVAELKTAAMDICGSPLEEAAPIARLLDEAAELLDGRQAPALAVEAAAIGELLVSSADWRSITLSRYFIGRRGADDVRFAASIRYDAERAGEFHPCTSLADDRPSLVSAVAGAFAHKAQRQASAFPDKFGHCSDSPLPQPALDAAANGGTVKGSRCETEGCCRERLMWRRNCAEHNTAAHVVGQ